MISNFHELKAFLTASGLLAAVLVVWLRFWVDLNRDREKMTGLLGRVWCLFATLVVLIGIAVAIQENTSRTVGYVPNEGIGLFLAGLAMTGIAVCESVFHAFVECCDYVAKGEYGTYGGQNGGPERKAMIEAPKTTLGRLLLVGYPIACALALVGGFVWFSCDNFSSCSGGMWYLVFVAAPLCVIPVPAYVVWDRLSVAMHK